MNWILFRTTYWRKRGEYPTQCEWTGITCFRVYGPYETAVVIEACEIREALTDYDFVGITKDQAMFC